MYGTQDHHAQLRAGTVEYMRQHPEEFKAFVTANPGGGIRRNPKRKNAGTLRDSFDPTPPSEADINTAFTLSLDSMAQGGTYGDNAELIAFSQKFNVDIRIWSTAIGTFLNIDSKVVGKNEVPTLYIVHHVSLAVHFLAFHDPDSVDLRTLLLDPQQRRPVHRPTSDKPQINIS